MPARTSFATICCRFVVSFIDLDQIVLFAPRLALRHECFKAGHMTVAACA